MNLVKNAELLIFDLDGTLYEDTDHFSYHAKQLKHKLPDGVQDRFWKEYEQMVSGLHVLTIGKVYDVQRDTILAINPETFIVEQVWDWAGEEWSKDAVQQTYPTVIEFDFEQMIAIGDGWWFPFANALHYGLTTKDTYDSYVKTKEYMVSGQFTLTKTKGLKQQLLKWKQSKTIILVTNSEEYDVRNLLKELDLENLFHDVVTSAKKPANTKQHFTRIMDKWNVTPEQTVSIGDNFINEIAPALQMNMKAVLINPQASADEWDNEHMTVIESMTAIIESE
ncbi:HAD family hydrolase [Pontibacillus litoralis]|uniref:Hydrolase n=1 Tax=Pontibacillus litoralis JSM 072002 TaxID=1385512 RepID=A0A0A5G3R0_9BACI|nr:HAD family hydrolase [Pontibacillus litoralis]KGX87756.1 hydrolase [Pontibacillus litoralis JSM 072002]